TLDVVRAVAESGRDDVALYTGNDDNIVLDLLTPYRFNVGGRPVEHRIWGVCWVTGRFGPARPLNYCASVIAPSKEVAPFPPNSCGVPLRSRTAMRPSSTRRITLPVASPVCTRYCGGRGCLKASGVLTPMKV